MEAIGTIPARGSINAIITCRDGVTGEIKWQDSASVDGPPLIRKVRWGYVILGAACLSALFFAAFVAGKALAMLLFGAFGLVFTAGHNLVLDRAFKTVPADVNWYILLTGGTPTFNVADTMSSHAGWTEVTAYSNGTRPAWTPGTIASGAVNNSGSLATFNMNGAYTVGGFAMTTNNTKGGSTGSAYGGAAFTNRSGDSPDVITIQGNLSQA